MLRFATICGNGGTADATGLGPVGVTPVGVQIPLPAPTPGGHDSTPGLNSGCAACFARNFTLRGSVVGSWTVEPAIKIAAGAILCYPAQHSDSPRRYVHGVLQRVWRGSEWGCVLS